MVCKKDGWKDEEFQQRTGIYPKKKQVDILGWQYVKVRIHWMFLTAEVKLVNLKTRE